MRVSRADELLATIGNLFVDRRELRDAREAARRFVPAEKGYLDGIVTIDATCDEPGSISENKNIRKLKKT